VRELQSKLRTSSDEHAAARADDAQAVAALRERLSQQKAEHATTLAHRDEVRRLT
jgi:1,6-anhydro-N-acetylmuramate kinase